MNNDTAMGRVNSLLRRSTSFNRDVLASVPFLIDHTVLHGDWTPLAKLIGKTQGDIQSTLRAIVKRVVGPVLVNDTKATFGVKLAMDKAVFDAAARTTLNEFVAGKASILGKTVQDEYRPKADKPAKAPGPVLALPAPSEGEAAPVIPAPLETPVVITSVEALLMAFEALSAPDQARFRAMIDDTPAALDLAA